jgi:PBSX family phage portal protein
MASAAKKRTSVVKMQFLGYDGAPPSNAIEKQEKALANIFGQAGALQPPHSLLELGSMVEDSNILPQCIRSYVTNIDLFGHRFVPIIDLADPKVDEKISDVIYLERLYAAEDTQVEVAEPTPAEIDQRKKVIASGMRKEHAWLQAFFDHCTGDYSFQELRSRTRHDKESNGNGYWEVIRNGLQAIAELIHVPSQTVRLLPKGPWMKVKSKIRISPITTAEVEKNRRFRRYIQVCEGQTTYFKEFGDLRVMSAQTGTFYTDGADRKANLDAMLRAEPRAKEATELWRDFIYNPTGPYGLPRWIGNYLSVHGSHKMEYVNFLFFENKSIPPMAVMVEGGRLSKQSIGAFTKFIEGKVKGSGNFHKAIILEAIPAEGATGSTADGKIRIKIQPLTDAIFKDALFMGYDANNRNKIGESFLLPKILRGDSSDVNRATADAALAFAEQQVFAPERNAFDYLVDRTIMMDMGVLYHTFESNGPDLKNPEALATAAKSFENALSRNEIRQIASVVFGIPYSPVEGGDEPFALTLAGATGGLGITDAVAGAEQARREGNAVALAQHLIAIRKAVISAEQRSASEEFAKHKEESEGETVIPVQASEISPFLAQRE